jgi:hypothetical protein
MHKLMGLESIKKHQSLLEFGITTAVILGSKSPFPVPPVS